jgi:hydrophobic/amphiphilic exporter-1 (mainly G- bacteria), HAE1 family
LLLVPTFYDSIEITRDSAVAKLKARAVRWNIVLAFIVTMIEALLALIFVRLVYRLLKKLLVLVQAKRK